MNYKKSIIICSYLEGTIEDALSFSNWELENSIIICSDGGISLATKENIKADYLVGDFDSFDKRKLDELLLSHPEIEMISYPSEKDLTDTALAIELAISKESEEILIIGGMGGRVDHTLAIIQNLANYSSEKTSCYLGNSKNLIFVSSKNIIKLPANIDGTYFSVFSFDEKIETLSISGAKYPLSNYTLTNTYPIGISNQLLDEQEVIIEKSPGKVIVVISKD